MSNLFEKKYDFRTHFKNPETRKKILLGCGGFLAAILLFILGLSISVRMEWLGELPDKQELAHIDTDLATEVLSATGKPLGKYYTTHRSETRYEDLPNHLIYALVATEDARFYEHDGIDMRSMFRVLFKSILLRDQASGGGSTISQQLAKNLYPRKRYAFASLLTNKIREGIIAQRLEDIYSKEQILTLYLNTVSFGENTFGIEVAARRFFNTSPALLKPEESAVLVGMLKATTAYNPRLNQARSEARRNTVLSQMIKYGFMEFKEADSLQKLPIALDYRLVNQHDGPAPYFRDFLKQELSQISKTLLKPDGTPYNVYADGLKIYTTLDADLQALAETAVTKEVATLQKSFDQYNRPTYKRAANSQMIRQAVKKSDRYKKLHKQGYTATQIDSIFLVPIPMELFSWAGLQEKNMSPLDSIIYYQYFLHAGLLSMDPHSGHIKAWVGGIDHKFFQYDHVTSTRQVGSTFKPLVYAAALEKGLSPCRYISNEKTYFTSYDNWSPRNSDNEYGGEYSMEGGLTHSVNVVAVNLMMETGIPYVASLAQQMGIYHTLPQVPSLALGSADLSLYEMVSAYSSLTNGGYKVKPVSILKIENREGEVIYEAGAFTSERVISRQSSQIITQMLRSVVNRGTGAGLRYRYGYKGEVAGKTGTTQDQADGWFIGATPRLVTGVWVGGEDRRVHFNTLSRGQGARTAMPIWANYMNALTRESTFKDISKATFAPINPVVADQMACDQFQFYLGMSDFKAWWRKQNQPQSQDPFSPQRRYENYQEPGQIRINIGRDGLSIIPGQRNMATERNRQRQRRYQ